MFAFLTRRVAGGIILVFAISFLTFGLIYSGGTDIARSILGPEADQVQVAAKAAELGLDQPFMVQYWNWLSSALTGSLGKSWFSPELVTGAISSRFMVTFSIVLVTVIIVAILSVVFGVVAAVRGGWVDRAIQIISVVGIALPNFWIALVLVRLFAINDPVFPATGFVQPSVSLSGWAYTIVLPVIALTIGGIAASAQQIRSAVVDVMRQDYIRTLKSRGLSPQSVLFKHALRNASPPALTVLSLQFIGMMGGAVVIEKVFALPGLGMLALNATLRGDIPIIMGVVMTMAVIVVVVNLLIDLANGWANPKARLS